MNLFCQVLMEAADDHLGAVGSLEKTNRAFIDLERSETDMQKPPWFIYSEAPSSYQIRAGYEPLAPRHILIGPFHDSLVSSLQLEHLKPKYLQHCLERPSQILNTEKKKRICRCCKDIEAKKEFIKGFILKQKERICRCYKDYNFNCKNRYNESFADNVLLDSFFIIELFLRELTPSQYSNDRLMGCKWTRSGVREDLLLMSNQLPFFLLRELYYLVFGSSRYPSFDSLTRNYFKGLSSIIINKQGCPDNCFGCIEDCCRSFLFCYWTRTCCNSRRNSDGNYVAISVPNAPPLHFADFYRDRVVDRGNRLVEEPCLSSETRGGFIGVPSASKLKRAGVKIKAASKGGSLIDITFKNGVLTILPLLLHNDYSERRLQNLIAFEQCHYPGEASIFKYIKFMECLLQNEDDFILLVGKGVILNGLAGSWNEVKELLQRLCKDMILIEPTSFYPNVCQELKYHCENRWYRIVAWFLHKCSGEAVVHASLLIAFIIWMLYKFC